MLIEPEQTSGHHAYVKSSLVHLSTRLQSGLVLASVSARALRAVIIGAQGRTFPQSQGPSWRGNRGSMLDQTSID